MATIGNLFVSVGASTTGLNKGLDQASKRVSQFRNEVLGSLGKVPATGFLQSAFLEVETFFNKIKGDSEGAKRAMAEVGNLQNGLAKEIARGHEKVAAATKKSEKATADLAAATKFTKLKSSAQTTKTSLSGMSDKFLKADAAHTFASQDLIKSKAGEGSVSYQQALKNEAKALEKVNAILAERNRLEAKSRNMDKGLAKASAGLESRGIKLDKQGNPNLGKLTGTASAARTDLQVVKDNAIAKQQEYKDKIEATVSSLSSFAAMSVTSVAGLAVLGGGMIAATGAAIALTLSMARIADELNDQAQAMGLSAQSLQALRDTYLQLGVSAGAAEGQMQRLQISLQGGDDKTTGAAAAFKQLGLEMKDLREMQPDEALNATIDAIRKLGSQSLRMKALRDVFGRGGTGMAASVNATNKELKEAQERSDRLRIPDSMIKSLASTHDNVEMMHRGFTNMQMMFASSFSPAVDNMAKSMFDFTTTDTKGMNNAMNILAIVCAVIFDVLAMILGILKMIWKAFYALFEILVSGIIIILTACLKVVEAIVYALEWLIGSGHSISSAIADEAEVGFQLAKDLAFGAGEDVGAAFQAGVDAGRPDATMGVINKINAGESNDKARTQTAAAVKDPQETAMAENREALLKKLTELETAAREVNMTPLEISLEEVRTLSRAAGDNLTVVEEMAKRAANNLQAIAIGSMQGRLVEGLKQAQEELWLLQEGAAAFAYHQAKAAGATDQVAKGMQKTAEQTETLKKQTAELQTLKGLQESIARESATAGMNDQEKLAYQLAINGATYDEIVAQLELKDIANKANAQLSAAESWKDMVGNLGEEFDKVNTSREEQVRKLAQAAGMLGDDLDEAVGNALKLEKAILEAQKVKALQEASTSTLKDLEDEVRRLTVGDKAFKREQFARGADDEQMKQYDALTATAESLQVKDEEKTNEISAIGTIETAFGSFNFGLDVQKQILSSADQQTSVLQTIAANTGALAGMKNGVASGATSTAVIAGTDPQLAEANKLLALIESNTRGTLT